MNEENKIVIVADDGNVIQCDDVTIRHEIVNRDEVAMVEQEIANLEQQKIEIDEKLIDLKAKIQYAKKVIELADAQKAEQEVAVEQEQEQEVVANDEVADESENLGEQAEIENEEE